MTDGSTATTAVPSSPGGGASIEAPSIYSMSSVLRRFPPACWRWVACLFSVLLAPSALVFHLEMAFLIIPADNVLFAYLRLGHVQARQLVLALALLSAGGLCMVHVHSTRHD
jgi:hypothetical protein